MLNSTSDAPGADGDGSGVASVLELARTMATYEFDATIVFALFAGEEQGVYGSSFCAAQAKAAGRNIAGMFSNDIVGSSLGMTASATGTTFGCSRRGPPANETAQEASFPRTTRRRASSRGSSRTPPTRRCRT